MQCSSLTPAGAVWSSLRRAAAGEGAEAHDLQPGEVFGACQRGRKLWGARSAVRRRGDVFLGACRRRRRRGGLQLYRPRAAWGATGQLSGIWLGLWVSASGGAAQSASIFIVLRNTIRIVLSTSSSQCFCVRRKAEEQPVLCIESARRTAFISLRMTLRKTRPNARSATMEGGAQCRPTT